MADSDSDEDEDETEDGATGVGLISRRTNKRIEGDALRYTGMDKGDRDNTALRRGGYSYDSEDSDEDDSSEDDLADAGLAALPPAERDEILVQSAFRQIQKAQDRGRTDVQLTKDELAALERRRKRMEEEEAARKAARRKAKSQRISVPLSQLEPPTRKKKKAAPAQDLGSPDEADHVGYPPIGYFPPPKSRPPSGSQQPPTTNQDSRGSSPFAYSYVNASQPPTRQSSNARTRAARAHAQIEGSDSEESSDESSPAQVPGALDPFKYQVSGPRQTRATAAAASSSRRNLSAADVAYGGPSRSTSVKKRQVMPAEETSDDTSEEDSEGVQIVSPPQRRTRNSPVVVQDERGRGKEKVEKAKNTQSPPAKTSGGPSARRRRKKK